MVKKLILNVLLISLCTLSVLADNDAALLQRIVQLEHKLIDLETKLQPVLEKERIKGLVIEHQKRATERMMMDPELYPREAIRTIENLYKTAMHDWGSERCIDTLKKLIQTFPKSNRAGCAMLNLGQMTEGEEQLKYLNEAINKYSNCYFTDGVQVGAYGRLYLGMRLKKDGKDKKAEALFSQVKTKFADAVDHQGALLNSHLWGM